LLTTALFIVFGYMIMDLGQQLKATSHLKIIQHCGGRVVGSFIDMIITFFLFAALTAMIAGTGALFVEQFHISPLAGNLLMALITALTVLTGINGVIDSISIVVPFLLTAVIGTSLFALFKAPPTLHTQAPLPAENLLMNNWVVSAILYVSYNTIISIAVLGPLGGAAKNKKRIKNGVILGSIGLGMGALMIYFALSTDLAAVQGLEVPMLYIAGKIAPSMQLLYAFVLIAAVYTTAVGSLYGFCARFISLESKNSKNRGAVIFTTFLALIASQFGFSNLVKYVYPAVGYGGVVLLGALLYSYYYKGHGVRDHKMPKGGIK
jgi:uncharacterized membrane protein YkvI